MVDTPTWEIVLYVDGPITVRRPISTIQQKGFHFDDPFYSDIDITGLPSGLKATVTARAPDKVIAYKAAIVFFGQMIDALTLAINEPLHLGLTDHDRTRTPRHDIKRRIEKVEFENAFREAHVLGRCYPSFLRSLGWYRKGLTTDNPLDKFLAFWNAIEIVASKYYHRVPNIDKERAKKGSKNQVWECFTALWGPCEGWPVIPGQTEWIDESNQVRVDVAHGVIFIDIHKVTEVAKRLPAIEQICFKFLANWHKQFLKTDRCPPNESLSESSEQWVPE